MQPGTVLVCLAIVLGTAYSQQFPNPVECATDPCTTASCPAYLQTECRMNNWTCSADFYTSNGRRINVTKNCFRGYNTCRERQSGSRACSDRRICIEEPVSVEDGCRVGRVCQKTRCMIPPAVLPPMSCDDIVCTDPKLECEERQSGQGTVARCVVSIPESCDDVECDEGMTCELRRRARDERFVARCVPEKKDTENPRRGATCAEVECDEDEVCMVLGDNTGARCTKPPPPTDCSQLQCPEQMECLSTANERRVRCVLRKEPFIRVESPLDENPTTRPVPLLARSCDELDCEPGFSCLMIVSKSKNGNKQPVPTCKPDQCPMRRPRRPPRNCRELECGEDGVCVMCREGETAIPQCQETERPFFRFRNITRPHRPENGTRPDRERPERPDGVRPGRREKGMRPDRERPERPDRMRPGCRENGTRPDREQPERPDGMRPGRRENGTRPDRERPERPDGMRLGRRENGTRPDRERPERPDGMRPNRPDRERPDGMRPGRRENGTRPDRERPERPDGMRPGRHENGTRPDREKPERPDGMRPGRPDRERPDRMRPGRRENGTRPDRERPERPDGMRPGRPGRERPDGMRPGRRENGTRPDRERPERPDGMRLGRRENGTRPDRERPERPDGMRPGRRENGTRSNRPEDTRPERPDRRMRRCEEAQCRRGFECFELRREGRTIPMCVRMTNKRCRISPDFNNREKPEGREDEEERERPNRREDVEEVDAEGVPKEFGEDGGKDEGDTENEDREQPDRRKEGKKEDEEEDEETEDEDEEDEDKKDEKEGVEINDGKGRPPVTINRPRPPVSFRLPDLCSERACCPGEKCYISSTEGGRPRIAFCAPIDYNREFPPPPPPPTCEELECGQGYKCREREDESRQLVGRCVRRRGNNRPRPTRPPVDSRPTRRPGNLRPTRPPVNSRPTKPGNLRPTRPPVDSRPTRSGNLRPTGPPVDSRPTKPGNLRPTRPPVDSRPTRRPTGGNNQPRDPPQ